MPMCTDSALARLRKGFSGDCSMLDTAARRSGRSGFALLFDSNGENPEVIPLGDAGNVKVEKGSKPGHFAVTYGESEFETWNHAKPSKAHVDDPQRVSKENGESYEAIAGENWAKAMARSLERENATNGRFNPVNMAGDAAKRAKMTADAKREYEAGIARTERIAQQMKQASNKQWAGRR